MSNITIFPKSQSDPYRDYQLWQAGQPGLLATGESWLYSKTAAILKFPGPRLVLSSSPLNGGIQTDLNCVFNLNMQAYHRRAECRADNYLEALRAAALDLGLAADRTSGLGTSAWVERAVTAQTKLGGIQVTATVTGGVELNGVCAGDPASYAEIPDSGGQFTGLDSSLLADPESIPGPVGTLNIFLTTNMQLDPGCLTKALITVTEAKAAALADLCLPSGQSADPATGSGTDGVILISDCQGPSLTDSGTHSLLGQALGQAARLAIKRSILVNTGASTPTRHNILARLAPYGLHQIQLWQTCSEFSSQPAGQPGLVQDFAQVILDRIQPLKLAKLARDPDCFYVQLNQVNHDSASLVFVSLYLHLIDQYRKGLLEWGEALRECLQLFDSVLIRRWQQAGLDFRAQPRAATTVPELLKMLEYCLLYLIYLNLEEAV